MLDVTPEKKIQPYLIHLRFIFNLFRFFFGQVELAKKLAL